MRAALHHLARNADRGLARIVALLLACAASTAAAAVLSARSLMLWRIPVGGPLPDIADHVVEAKAVRRKRTDRRGALAASALAAFVRKHAIPGVGHAPAAGHELAAPGILRAIEATARGELPFRLGRQPLAGPHRIGLGIGKSDLHDGMIV